MKKLLTALVVVLPFVATAQYEPVQSDGGYAPAAPASRRSPWYIGFGFGGGSANVSAWGVTGSIEEFNQEAWDPAFGLPDASEFTFNFKIGATLSDKLLVGFDVTGISSLISEAGGTSSVTIANYDAMATYFPMGEGLFVRGGAGLSRLTGSWAATGGASDSEAVSGFNFLVGAGYALWIGQTFNLTLNLDYSLQSYGSAGNTEFLANMFPKPESSNFLAFWLGFDWY